MGSLYETIGRLVVLVVRLKFGKQLRVAGVVVAAMVVAIGYLLASREAEEG